MQKFVAHSSQTSKRVDVCIVKEIPILSRAAVQKLCEQGKVLINNKSARPSQKLKAGDEVTLDYDLAALDTHPAIELPVLYEDDDCVVINKPIGILSHSKGAFNPEATVATWLGERTTKLVGERAGIVHRLDRATSGVMIGAKTPEALSWLQKQFSQRKVKKTYVAVIAGKLEPPSAIIDMPIERSPKHPQTFRVGAAGKPAQTKYQTLKSNEHFSLISLQPATGRTHQLRVHLAQLKHPIVGDTLYGGQPAERLFLHAQQLEITLPNRQRKTFTAPAPAEFEGKLV